MILISMVFVVVFGCDGRNCCPISTPTSCHRVSTRACTPAAGSSPYSAPRWPFRWLAGNITIQMHTEITQKPSCLTLCANCRAKMGGWPFLESHFPAAAVHPRQYGNLLRPHILPSHSNNISKKSMPWTFENSVGWNSNLPFCGQPK